MQKGFMREFLKNGRAAHDMIDRHRGGWGGNFYSHSTSLAAFYINEKIGSNSNSKDPTVNGSTRNLFSDNSNIDLKSNIDLQYDTLITKAFGRLELELRKMFEESNASTLIRNEYSKLQFTFSYSLPSLALAICGTASAYLAISAPLKLLANSSLIYSTAGQWEAIRFLIGATSVMWCIVGFCIISDIN